MKMFFLTRYIQVFLSRHFLLSIIFVVSRLWNCVVPKALNFCCCRCKKCVNLFCCFRLFLKILFSMMRSRFAQIEYFHNTLIALRAIYQNPYRGFASMVDLYFVAANESFFNLILFLCSIHRFSESIHHFIFEK